MTISLKTINVYQDLDLYDVDVDNRPLLDIENNIAEIVSLLEASGHYSEIAADASSEPAGGFSTFSCACVYSNSLLIPIDISKHISEVDYSKFPIVLILGYKEDIKKYSCLFFSTGIKLANRFASFVPGSEGRLLRVGPGGELVDQMYYDLIHASKGYQALYVGKILSTTSIVFGGNQVSILGNNYFLAKNRDDVTSGLITTQRSNLDSNTVFKAINVNDAGSAYTFAEYINSYSPAGGLSESNIPVYFSNKVLAYNQSTGVFTDSLLEVSLNEVHFSTPALTTLSGANQSYKTSGVNVRSLFDFASANLTHSAAYSNTVSELTQSISTKLVFTDREKSSPADPDIPIGLGLNSVSKFVGAAMSGWVKDSALDTPQGTNLPTGLLPTEDTTGMVFGDYFGNGTGAYVGSIKDINPDNIVRTSLEVDTIDQESSDVRLSSTTNKISEYTDSFNFVISAKSSTSVPSNIVLSADGYINLSSAKGVLIGGTWPTLDSEVVHKKYVDISISTVAVSDSQKVPLTGTVSGSNITGSLTIDVAGNVGSNNRIMSFNALTMSEIESTKPIKFTFDGGLQSVQASTNTDVDFVITPGDKELVNKDYLLGYVANAIIEGTGSYVTLGDIVTNDDQLIYGEKTFGQMLSSVVVSGQTNLRLKTTALGALPVDLVMATDGTLTISTIDKPVLLDRATEAGDPDNALTTNKYVKDAIAVYATDTSKFYAVWNVVTDTGYKITAGSNDYICRHNSGGTGGATEESNLTDFFTPGSSGLVAVKAVVLQVNASISYVQNLGADQYRASCHILKNGVDIASTHSEFDGPSGFSARPAPSVSSVVVLAPGDILVVGAKLNNQLSVGVPIMHCLSMVKVG